MEIVAYGPFNLYLLSQSLKSCSKCGDLLHWTHKYGLLCLPRQKANIECITFSGLEHACLVFLILVSRTVVLHAVNNLPSLLALKSPDMLIQLCYPIPPLFVCTLSKSTKWSVRTVASFFFFFGRKLSCVLSESFLEKQSVLLQGLRWRVYLLPYSSCLFVSPDTVLVYFSIK